MGIKVGVTEDVKVGVEGNGDEVGEAIEVGFAREWEKRCPSGGGAVEEVQFGEGGIL